MFDVTFVRGEDGEAKVERESCDGCLGGGAMSGGGWVFSSCVEIGVERLLCVTVKWGL